MKHNLPADVLDQDRGQSPWGQWAQKSQDLIRRPQTFAGPDDLIGELSSAKLAQGGTAGRVSDRCIGRIGFFNFTGSSSGTLLVK